jgi:hypothetical protein
MMTIADIIDPDLPLIGADDPRTVSYERRTGGDAYAPPVVITGAVRNPLQGAVLSAAGVTLPASSVVYHIQASQAGARPGLGDRISEGTKAYMVDSAATVDEGRRYRVVCVPEV